MVWTTKGGGPAHLVEAAGGALAEALRSLSASPPLEVAARSLLLAVQLLRGTRCDEDTDRDEAKPTQPATK